MYKASGFKNEKNWQVYHFFIHMGNSRYRLPKCSDSKERYGNLHRDCSGRIKLERRIEVGFVHIWSST